MEQQWARAVRLEQAGSVLHIVLQHAPTQGAAAEAAAKNGSQQAE
jgi:hypothetical protein